MALLVYDITKPDTFNAVTSWVDELKENARGDPFILLVGNKSDLETERQVTNEIVQNYITSLNDCKIIGSVECSALNGTNIDKIFELISKKLLEMC